MADNLKIHKKKTWFTDQEQVVLIPEERLKAVQRLIRLARRRLLISVFRCSEKTILAELTDALRRKVEVHTLVTPRAKGGKLRLNELGSLLESMGAKVHRYPDQVVKYHAKYLVVDEGPAMVASLNFTKKCFRRTCDFLQISFDPGVVAGLTRLFESDCRQAQNLLPLDLNDRLIVGPDRARVQLTELLQSACKSIHIIDSKAGDADILTLLKAKKAAGVDVQILNDSALGELTSHGKLILVDDSTAVFGSISLSTLSLDFRRELAIKVQDPGCVSRLVEFFESLVKAKSSGDKGIVVPASP